MTITRATIDALSDDDVHQILRWCMARVRTPNRQRKPSPGSIATLAPGESALYPWGQKQLNRRARFARKMIGEPDARWSARTTTKGLRVTRIR